MLRGNSPVEDSDIRSKRTLPVKQGNGFDTSTDYVDLVALGPS